MLACRAARTLSAAVRNRKPLVRTFASSNFVPRSALAAQHRFRPHQLFQVPARGLARYEGDLPNLGPDEFIVLTPEVSGPGGMTVPAELGEVVEIHFKPGDQVGEDDIVAVIETCKAAVEARCRSQGIVKELLVAEGEEVYELQPILIIKKL